MHTSRTSMKQKHMWIFKIFAFVWAHKNIGKIKVQNKYSNKNSWTKDFEMQIPMYQNEKNMRGWEITNRKKEKNQTRRRMNQKSFSHFMQKRSKEMNNFSPSHLWSSYLEKHAETLHEKVISRKITTVSQVQVRDEKFNTGRLQLRRTRVLTHENWPKISCQKYFLWV